MAILNIARSPCISIDTIHSFFRLQAKNMLRVCLFYNTTDAFSIGTKRISRS